MRGNMFLKSVVIMSSMLSFTVLPAMLPANADVSAPVAEAGGYLTNEQFTEYNLWTNYINDYPNDVFGYVNRANIQYAAKNYKKAIDDYNKALSIDQYNSDAYLKRGNCYFVMNDRSRALLDYMSAVKIKPDLGEAYFNMGRIYYDQNDFNNAVANMSKGVAYVNNRSDYFYELGRAQYKISDYQNAYNNFTNSISIDNKNADAQFARGLAALNIGSYEAAAQSFDNALKINPNYKDAQYYKGLASYQAGNFNNAVSAFDSAVALAPEDALIYNLRGCAKELSGDKAGAKKDYKRAKELGLAKVGLTQEAKDAFAAKTENVTTTGLEPDKSSLAGLANSNYVWTDKPITPKERKILDEAARERLIKEALASGDIYGTIAMLERIAEDEPQNPEHYITLAETKLSVDSYTGVISDAETALMNGSNNPQAYYLEGLAYKNKGNRVNAYRNFAMSYNADKQNPDYIYNFADASYNIGRYPEAYELAASLLDNNLEERFKDARLLKAKAEYKLGKYYSAVDDCNKYLKKNKGSVEAYVYSALSKEALEKYDEAIKDYSKAIHRDWKNVELYKKRGNLQLAQGHDLKALYDFDKVLALKGDSATSYDHLIVAELEEDRGNYDNAIACYSNIIKQDELNDAAYVLRAKAYKAKGNVYDAVADFSSALRLNPYQTSIYKERGVLLVQMKSYRRGIEDLNKALRVEPDNGLLYYYRALANKAMGRLEEADADYAKAKKFEAL